MRAHFPLNLRIGTDIIATDRILSPVKPDVKRMVRLSKRFLHPRELNDLNRRFPEWRLAERHDNLQPRQAAAWIAGRWAAKEAAKKAWDAALLSFRDLRVEIESGGGVCIICDTHLQEGLSSSRQVTEQVAQLSISHDGDYTLATVLASPLHPDISAELQSRKAEAESKVVDKPSVVDDEPTP